MAERRLDRILHELSPAPSTLGQLTLGDITYDVPASLTPSRLPHSSLLDTTDSLTLRNLHFILQKYLLGQDVFLLSQPGPYARRLAMTFCSMINAEYEHIALHRDVGETELKQGREIRAGGNLVYVDSAAVRAVKYGRVLIIEGIEKAERGIMPVLNNLLENREMNLDDGTHILHPHRHALLASADREVAGKVFIPAHKNFRVIAIAAPVPPYTGFPLDPPFRSRFQARFVDPAGSLLAIAQSSSSPANLAGTPSELLYSKLRDLILSTQYASETKHALDAVAMPSLPAFPQTALLKLRVLVDAFPPPPKFTPGQLARLLLTLHPALAFSPFQAWALLSSRTEEAGLGLLGGPQSTDADDPQDIGLMGYRATSISRVDEHTARVIFESSAGVVKHNVPAGPHALLSFPLIASADLVPTPRFVGLLTSFLQVHALGWDISYVPPALPSTASASTSLLVRAFSAVLGYECESIHLYKELGGRELVMRRKIENGGATSWEPSPLLEGAWAGRLVHLSGLDVLGLTAGSLARLTQDRELELWEGNRIVASMSEDEVFDGLSTTHASFRMISTSSKSAPLRDWLTDEHANMFFTVPALPMAPHEERDVLLHTGCSTQLVDTLLAFAEKYRASLSTDNMLKNRKLGTRALVRICRRLAKYPLGDDLHTLLSRTLLAEFLPTTERMNLDTLLEDSGIKTVLTPYHPSLIAQETGILFPEPTSPTNRRAGEPTFIPYFDAAKDREGVASFIPHMDHFFDNSLQTGLLRDLAIDFEMLGEHLVLLGNQGVGKNKLIDRLCQILRRPREYIQLHRDTTVNQLMFQTTLENGVICYTDSPLLRAVVLGRIIVIDEADKAPEHVVAIFRSLAGQGELTLTDGRRVRRRREREGDIIIHPDFRLILLANRPGYPFLGNHFLQVLGDNFSCHSVTNPDIESEHRLLSQLAPELDEDVIIRLVGAFHDLRKGYEDGSLTYPYSLRELIAIVRHMRAYPTDTLDNTLRNVFDFDVYKPDTMEKLATVLEHHGLRVHNIGLDASRESAKVLDLKFEPKATDLSKPKYGKEDPNNAPHTGGNTWAGGTGGRDTAGLGGRGGYMRLFKGHDINQVSDKLKQDVPESVKEQAREMARQELARRLEELNMSAADAKGYGSLLTAVQAHTIQLHDLLEHLAAKEEERVWVKRQTDGELDDGRLAEGLTGEATVYKRRGMAKPELGRPQIKPKRIRFVFDVSGSMYRFQYDGRLQRSLETAVMIMESFNRLSRKDKYAWDMYGHSGDSPEIPLVQVGESVAEVSDRWKIAQKMEMITQYTFAGDHTVEAIEKAAVEVSRFDGDDHFVIAITDANFARYGITAEELERAMNRHPKVKTALICIGEGAEASWVPKHFPGRAFRVGQTADIPKVLRGILSTMMEK
ncbi:AAA domain-containing protein [Amylostereum chailletii]|nr:AAA domain-containing protein [Amylostereum chailletii]